MGIWGNFSLGPQKSDQVKGKDQDEDINKGLRRWEMETLR